MSGAEHKQWELLIIGGGPAGLTAGIYATRSGLKTLLIEGACTGGQIIKTNRIENYPGFPHPVKGTDLMEGMRQQAEGFGLHVREFAKVVSLETGNGFTIGSENGEINRTIAIIVATGTQYRDLEVPGAKRLKGRGISYCATCDGPFFKNEPIMVVGGGNAAIEEAIYLTRFASVVYVAHRRDRLRADKVLQDRAFADKKITVLWNKVVHEIVGSERVERVILEDVATREHSDLPVSGLFVYIGTTPNTELLKGIVKLDDQGYIITDQQMATSHQGIFAAGDCRHKSLRQVATAVGEGALAAATAYEYILERQGNRGQ